MNNRVSDFFLGVIVGVPVTFTLIYLFWWFSTYTLAIEYQLFILGFIFGAVILHCLHSIDWSVGF